MNKRILELLKTKFGKVKAVSGGGYRITCPTCDPAHAKKMKRYINPQWPQSNCFICNKAIPIAELLGADSAGQFKNAAPEPFEEEYKYAKIAPYRLVQKLSELPQEAPVVQFMLKDHLSNWAYYDSVGIRYIPQNGGMNIAFDSGFTVNTAESLFFPMFAEDGEYVGWQLRFIPGTWNGDRFQFMRYMHLFPKGNYLFNYAFAKQHESVVVVEGAKKALKLGNAVATLGKGISDRQKQLITRWRKIILMLDSEDNTQAQAEELCEEFRHSGRKCLNINLGKYGFASPDEATTEELITIISNEQKR